MGVSELLVEPIKSEVIFELYRRNAEAAEWRDQPQPGSQEYQALHPEWRPPED